MIQDCDTADVSPADYTILVKNLPLHFEPKNGDIDEDLKDFFTNNIVANKKLNVVSVNICYDISEKIILQEKMANII